MSLLIEGLVLGIPFSLLTVWILGKTKSDTADAKNNDRLQMSASEWAWRLAVAAILYLIVYFPFGHMLPGAHRACLNSTAALTRVLSWVNLPT